MATGLPILLWITEKFCHFGDSVDNLSFTGNIDEEQRENAIEPDDPAEEQQENTTDPDEPTSTEEQQENATEPRPTDMDWQLARELYKQLVDGTHTAEEVKSEDILHKIAEKLESKRICMQNQCQWSSFVTAKGESVSWPLTA